MKPSAVAGVVLGGVLGSVLLVACDKRCDGNLDQPDSITVEVDTSSGVPSFSWDGGEIAILDVWIDEGAGQIDTGIGVAGGSPKAGTTLLWRVQCDYVAFQKRGAIRQNCISGPVRFGEAPDGAEEAAAPDTLPAGTTLSVKAHRFPEIEAEGCYAYADGTGLFVIADGEE